MKHDVFVKEGIIIPSSEIELTASKSGGPGGQHVNKTDSRIMLRWNVEKTIIFNEIQKETVLNNLSTRLTNNGDLIIQVSASRSQQQNRIDALSALARCIKKAMYIPKKRMETRVPKSVKESRLKQKNYRGNLKKMRNKKKEYYDVD